MYKLFTVKKNLMVVGIVTMLCNYGLLYSQCQYTTVTFRDPTAGNITPGSVIQLRVNISVPAATTLFGVSLWQQIPAGLTYIPNSIRLINPNGTTIAGYTDAPGDDLAQFSSGLARINVGFGANATNGGNVIGNVSTPIFGSTTQITMALNVSVTGALGYIISSTGYATYRITPSGAIHTCTGLSPIQIQISNNSTLCVDDTGPNMFTNAFSGTFGQGTALNFGTIAGTSYGYQPLTNNQPQDGFYSVVNSTDWNGSSTPGGGVFGDGYWTIFGDHTGATNPLAGNPAPVTGSLAGYMLVVNASYAPDVVISDNITGLCPDMYYEYSAWIRNICPSCGGAPYSGNPGVLPNIAFSVDNVEQYSSGDIAYTGQWQQVGFQYLTKPGQTSLNVKIRNNAPGGGGNDWALDDISFRSCIPIVTFNTGYSPTVCGTSVQDFVATVTSKYPNFTAYKWQKSTDNGVTWADISSTITTTSNLIGSNYTYMATLVGVNITLADNGAKYAIVVGSSPANVASTSCSFRSTVVNMQVVTLPNVNISTYMGTITTTACNLPTGITITASGGNSYLWSNSATTTSINIAATSVSGIYAVTATGTAQCKASKTVTILGMGINPCNAPPTVTNVGVSMPRNAANTTIPGLKASDVDGVVTYYTITSVPAASFGTLYHCSPGCTAINVNGTTLTGAQANSLSFDPSGSFIGVLNFSFSATDNGGGVSTSTGIYNITLTSANVLPTASNLTFTGLEDNFLINTVTGFADADADPLTVTSFVGSISNGVLTLLGNGAITFLPNLNFFGTTNHVYSVCDPFGCTTANLVFVINAVNDAPFVSVTPITVSGMAGVTNTGSITGWGDVDNALSQLTVSGLSPIAVTGNGTLNTITGGTVTIGGQGLVTFRGTVPGVYSINYQVCDPTVTCTSAMLTVSIGGALPLPGNDGYITDEKTSIVGLNVLTNDFNPNTGTSVTGLTLNTATTLLGPNIGVLSVNGTGAFTFVPTVNLAVGVTTVTSYRYQVCNVTGCSTAQAVFSVTGVNDAPVVNNYTISGEAGLQITGNLLIQNIGNNTPGSIYDADTYPITLVGVSDLVLTSTGSIVLATQQNQILTIGGNGSILYSSSTTFSGIDFVAVSVTDGLATTTGSITIVVSPSLALPIALADVNITDENTTVAGDLLANDINPITGSNVGLTVTGVTIHPGGSLLINSITGQYIFTPNIPSLADGVTTTIGYTYTVCNINGCTTSGLTISVTGVNNPPVAVVNTLTGVVEDMLYCSTIVGFSDVDSHVTITSGVFTISGVGTVTVSGWGEFCYMPLPDLTGGPFVIPYSVCDAFTCTSSNLLFSITGVNDAPVVNNFTISGAAGFPLSNTFTLHDVYNLTPGSIYDVDNFVLTLNGLVLTSSGVLTAFTTENQLLTILGNGQIFYQSNTTFSGLDTYALYVTDGLVTTSGTLFFNIGLSTALPMVVNDNISGLENTTISGNVLSNDQNPLTGNSTGLTVSGVSNPDFGIFTIDTLTGVFTFIPDIDIPRNVTTATTVNYQVCNINGCVPGSLSFTVTGVNGAPSAVNLTFSGIKGQLIETSITGWSDPDGDMVTVSITGLPSTGTLSGAGFNLAYTSPYTFTGILNFTYMVFDPDGLSSAVQTVTISVTGDNIPPVAVVNTFTGAVEDQIFCNTITGFSDLDDTPTVQAGVFTTPGGGSITISGTGAFCYYPGNDVYGVITVTYAVCDATTCTSSNLIFDISGINDAPALSNDFAVTTLGGAVDICVLCNDSDVDGNLVTSTLGVVTNVPSHAGIVTANTLTGIITFIPVNTFTGTAQFMYSVCDNGSPLPSLCSTALGFITVTGNNMPVAVSNTFSGINEDDVFCGNVSGASDVDDSLTFVSGVFSLPNGGGVITINGNGSFCYYAGDNVFGGPFIFPYTVCGGSDCLIRDLIFTVNGINDAPFVAAPAVVSVFQNTTHTGNITGFGDVDNPVSELTVSTIAGGLPKNGSITLLPDGSYIYTPNNGFTGADTLFYNVCDNAIPSLCTQGIWVITVLPASISSNPIANPSTILGALEDTPFSGVISNVFDPNNLPLIFSAGVITTNGGGTITLQPDGSFIYFPATNFNGLDCFAFTVCNSAGACANAAYCISVTGVNDNPKAVRDVFEMPTATYTFANTNTVLFNDSDPDEGDAIKVVPQTNTITEKGGSFSINAEGIFTYTKPDGFAGTDSVMYVIEDAFGAKDTAYVVIIVPFTGFIPDGFSPNGDGIFDTWKIQKPEGVQLKIEIFNRWGDVVYRSNDFTEWDGTCNTGLKIGDDLPDGTYYYYVEYNNSNIQPRKGYITLSR